MVFIAGKQIICNCWPYSHYTLLLAPTVTASISPTLFTGDSGEDAVELLCTVAVMEDIVEALYQFTWMKNGNSLDILSNRIQVLRSVPTLYVIYVCFQH